MRRAPVRLCALLALALVAPAPGGRADAADGSPPPSRSATAPVQPGSAPDATRYALLPGVSLRYEDRGARDAPVVVLLHEMGMSLESWDDVMPDLARGHRVIRYDLRGFGLSEKIVDTVSFDQEADDLAALLGALGVKRRVVLIGGAVGGATALAFAARYPDRVAGLVALSPAAGVAPEARAGVLASADRIARTGMRPLLGDMFDIYPAAIRTDPARVERFRAIQLSTDPRSLAATLRMIATTDFAPILARVRCPALIVAAKLYPARPEESVRALARQLSKGRFAALPTGHFMGIQAPDQLLSLVRPFLAETLEEERDATRPDS